MEWSPTCSKVLLKQILKNTRSNYIISSLSENGYIEVETCRGGGFHTLDVRVVTIARVLITLDLNDGDLLLVY